MSKQEATATSETTRRGSGDLPLVDTAVEAVKQLIEKSTESAKAAKAKGLVPQSGDEAHPGRWVKPGNQNKKKRKAGKKKPLRRHKHKGSTIRIQETNAPANRARK